MSLIASTITKACFAWMLLYVIFGASSAGKSFFSDMVWMDDTKGGVALVMLTYPALIAASIGALLQIRRSRRSCLCPPKSNRWKVGILRPFFQRMLSNHGDGNFDLYAFLFLFIPLMLFAYSGIHRRTVRLGVSLPKVFFGLQRLDEDTASDVTAGVANALGMAAVVAMAFFLIPTSKHGPILKLFGWSHALAIRLHIWCGRILVVFALLHGMFYTILWKYHFGEDYQAYLFPPRQCWTSEDFAPTCKNPDTTCTCYFHFLYFSGTVAVFLMLVILITSSNYVRRKFYSFFLTSHLLLAPLCILAVAMHYNRAIVFMSASILYYLATTLPHYFEQRRDRGVQVVSVEVIGSGINKYVSLTFEATPDTVRAFRPGMYTNLSVPSISNVAHPLTVIRVPGKDDQLRIIFRAMGPFTRNLATLLEAEAGIPIIHLDGFHGIPSRLYQLRHHDVNVIVAGGIGVTPFLSLLEDAVDQSDDMGHHIASRMKRLSFHWMCREASLIEYIRREYLMHLDGKPTPSFESQLQIHHTGMDDDVSIKTLSFPSETVQECEPFKLSRFYPSGRVISNLGRFVSLSALLWPGLAIIWYFYSNFQSKHEMASRLFAPTFLVAYVILASYFLARTLPRDWFGRKNKDDFKMSDESEHSYEETLPLSRSPSACQIGQTMEGSSPHYVALQCSTGRPELDGILECLDDARWPAIYSCGPSSMSSIVKIIAEDKSKARTALEPTRSSPLITIYDEAFLL